MILYQINTCLCQATYLYLLKMTDDHQGYKFHALYEIVATNQGGRKGNVLLKVICECLHSKND